MKIKKAVLLFIFMVLFCSITSFNVMAATVDDAGVKMIMVSAEDGIMTMKVQMKLPADSGGVTSFANIISYDNTQLTLVDYATATTEYTTDENTATNTYTSPIINVSLTDTNNTPYGVFDATISTVDTRSTLKTTLMTQITGATVADPNTSQNTTAWQDVYYFKFKIAGTGDPKTELDQNSLRFFDATADSANLAAADLNWTTFFDALSDGTQYVNGYTGSDADPPTESNTMGEVVLYYRNESTTAVTISGKISSYNPKNEITVNLMQDANATPIKSITIPAADTGSGVIENDFAITEVEPGTYNLVIEKDGHVDFTITGIEVLGTAIDLTTNTNSNISDMTMIVGDVNGSNSVNSADVSIIRKISNYNKNTSAAGVEVITDIDGGGSINSADVSIVRAIANYNKQDSNTTFNYDE